VNDILDLAKVEVGRLQVSSGPASAVGTLAAAMALIQPQAAARSLQLDVVPPPEPSPIYRGDDERARQILVNLLSNAVKFTAPGGKIRLEIQSSQSPDPDTKLQVRRTYVSFRVTDTGRGIPEEKLNSIFDPFVQAETGHARSREGSGLGLTISRRLARLMGGDLTVTSKIGEGSTFTLWLPADLTAKEVESTIPIAGETVTAEPQVEGLGTIGRVLITRMDSLIETIVNRVRWDQSVTMTAGLKFSQLADHLGSLLADLGAALIIMEEAQGSPSGTMADAVEIQRLISERHGAQRQRLGWTESALRREFMIVREEIARVVRTASEFGDPLPVEDGLTVLGRFLDQAEYVAVRSLKTGVG